MIRSTKLVDNELITIDEYDSRQCHVEKRCRISRRVKHSENDCYYK